MVAFDGGGRNPYTKKVWILLITSAPSVCHESLKKPDVRPSGPGDLFLFSLKRTHLISSRDGKTDMEVEMSGEQRKLVSPCIQMGEIGSVS